MKAECSLKNLNKDDPWKERKVGLLCPSSSIYKGFAAVLAARNCVSISDDVGQHEVYEEGRLLAFFERHLLVSE